MAGKHHVLIFPAGSEIGLEIYNSLRHSHHVEVFGASGRSDHASFVYAADRYVEDELLYVDRPDFVDQFNELLSRLSIEFVYPTHDTIAAFLSAHQPELVATVITSGAEANRIARHKRATYDLFQGFAFCPTVFAPPYRGLPYPVFLKPDDGQGGKGAFRADDQADLAFYLRKFPDLLVTEFLPGDELSVDCFTDLNGDLLFVGPRTRERVTMGISFRSASVPIDSQIRVIADDINRTVQPNGAWFFQLKQDVHGQYKLLEFAARQSSTMGLYRAKGINFALLSLFNALMLPVEIIRNDFAVQLDRSLESRYRAGISYRRIYIDLDETIIAGDRVNDQAMALLYQSRNRGIAVHLLTKHAFDVVETLTAHGIAPSLFSEIRRLRSDEPKWDFIEPEGSIFIDNYWYDRREVSQRLGIPVFDVDAIECLLC